METKTMIETKRTGTGKNVYPEYYEAVAAIAQPRHFPSPVNDSKFICADVDYDPLFEIPDGSVDRIIMTNTFQDIKIVSETPLILPKNIWMNSVAAQGREHTNTRRLELMDKLAGYPGGVEIIAKLSRFLFEERR